MIYTKNANFPYPILHNFSDDYNNANFDLEISLKEDNDDYIIEVGSTISSNFIKRLIDDNKAKLVLIVKSIDNNFMELQSYGKETIVIPNTNISFDSYSKKNSLVDIQLMIKSNEDITFENNDDLNEFYNEYKKSIVVKKGNALGFSSVQRLDSRDNKPFDLFDKRKDETIKSDIKVELSEQMITIVYRSDEIMFDNSSQYRDLLNPYLYIGLQKALTAFIMAEHGDGNDNDGLDKTVKIDDVDEISLTPLNGKLYRLMKDKGVEEISFDSMDLVIHKISDFILKRYVNKIGGIIKDEY